MVQDPSTPIQLAPGRWHYALERVIGTGASGAVWRGRDTDNDEPVAVKVGHSREEAPRLASEAERLVFLDNPRLARLVGVGSIPEEGAGQQSGLEPGLPYLVTRWVEGEAPLEGASTEAALQVARDVGEALAELHRLGLAHGDVKPANVVLGPAGATLIDLGLADSASTRIPVGATLSYLAPETGDPHRYSDARARDLWALGVTVAECAGRTPATCARPEHASADLPEPLARIVSMLLSPAPAARPAASWVHRVAAAAAPHSPSPTDCVQRRRTRVRSSYLAAHGAMLHQIAHGLEARVDVDGPPGEWLRRAVAFLEAIARLRGKRRRERLVLRPLDALGRSRWLSRLVGLEAARWPALNQSTDATLAEQLLRLAQDADPEAWTYGALANQAAPLRVAPATVPDPLEIVLCLNEPAPQGWLLDAAEQLVVSGEMPDSVVLALGRALRLRGELGRALAALGRASSEPARVEAAETLRRAGDRDAAERLLETPSHSGACEARRRAVLARIHLDRGEAARALETLAASADAATCEVRALAYLGQGELANAESAARLGLAASETNEQRCRLEAVAGNIAHAQGRAADAFDAFTRAADHAAQAGAMLEEATYLTGLAACAFDLGRLGHALDASQRSILLFECLGRVPETARALLSRAAVYASVRAEVPTHDAASDAIRRATEAQDARCQAFAHLAVADALAPGSARGRERAARAVELLETAPPFDQLRAWARVLLHGGEVDRIRWDAVASDEATPAASRLDWWSARAMTAAGEEREGGQRQIMTELKRLIRAPTSVPAHGPAMTAALHLAGRVGDGDSARLFAHAASEAAQALQTHCPTELRAAIAGLQWLGDLRAPGADTILPEQLSDVEALVRALSARDRLKPLLDQVLDTLVLWTGVERGLLLLRAPTGRLQVRAARNIARHALGGEQLKLSRTLADRALESGEPVVAVDATGELPELHASVHALRLRSVLAVPLLARGEAIGVVYLDDRARAGAFGPPELAWVKLVAALAAVAIADARDQLLLQRAARRARRAEARAAAVLATREAELDVARAELSRTRGSNETRFAYDEIVGASTPVRTMLHIVDRVTASEVPVLITGESGSGKELVARAIHNNGPRGGAAFVTENCSAIPEGLLESTLFGHVRGAFTGAVRPRAGLFEVADGGTLFLDEIGDMSLPMQTKLLRVLEDNEVRPVGSDRPRTVDVRIIAATHRDLQQLADAGSFRSDLLYRLNVVSIAVPALRTRSSDVEVLARHFIKKHGGGRSIRVSKTALRSLTAYPWPGNIRQLENEIRRAIIFADEVISPEHLTPAVRDSGRAEMDREKGLNIRQRVDSLESELVQAALERTNGNQTRAAELLGLSRFGLQKMMKRLQLSAVPDAGRGDRGAVTGTR